MFDPVLGVPPRSPAQWCVVTGRAATGSADLGDIQRVEYAVARILAESDQPVEVYGAVLPVIGSSLGWELGAVWEIAPGESLLRCVRTWHSGKSFPEFEALSERITLRRGEGLPGMVVESGEPA